MIDTYANKLTITQTFKNYKELCLFLQEKCKTGESKKAQLKEWERCFSYKKDGHKFIITEIYEEPKEKIDGRKNNGGNISSFKGDIFGVFNISNDEMNNTGVYIIQLNNTVYIGSTIVGFRIRYTQHCCNHGNHMPHTQQLLKDGATFSILYTANADDTEEIIRQKENDYIEQYIINGYDVLNTRIPNVIYGSKQVNSKLDYKDIKIKGLDFDKVIEFLDKNNIDYKVG